jgi:hypothetical protein
MFEWSLEIWWDFITMSGPPASGPFPLLTARDGHQVPHAALFPVTLLTVRRAAQRWWPPVIVAPCRLATLSLCLDVTRGGHRPFCIPLTPFDCRLLAALLCNNRRFTRRRQPPMSHHLVVRPGQKKGIITAPRLHQEPNCGTD